MSLKQNYNQRERGPGPQKEKGKQPDFTGNGIAVWINEKNGEEYLTISILGGQVTLAAFPNKKKEAP